MIAKHGQVVIILTRDEANGLYDELVKVVNKSNDKCLPPNSRLLQKIWDAL